MTLLFYEKKFSVDINPNTVPALSLPFVSPIQQAFQGLVVLL